jgi:hypothetical protein
MNLNSWILDFQIHLSPPSTLSTPSFGRPPPRPFSALRHCIVFLPHQPLPALEFQLKTRNKDFSHYNSCVLVTLIHKKFYTNRRGDAGRHRSMEGYIMMISQKRHQFLARYCFSGPRLSHRTHATPVGASCQVLSSLLTHTHSGKTRMIPQNHLIRSKNLSAASAGSAALRHRRRTPYTLFALVADRPCRTWPWKNVQAYLARVRYCGSKLPQSTDGIRRSNPSRTLEPREGCRA